MAIEKMELVNIAGLLRDLDTVLLRCCQSGCFHIEVAVHSGENKSKLVTLNDDNPYTPTLKRLIVLASNVSFKLMQTQCDLSLPDSIEEIKELISSIENQYNEIYTEKNYVLKQLSEHKQALRQLKHLYGLGANFEEIFSCEHVKVRVGKLPVDSYPKLEYYGDKTFFFVPFDFDESYCWGMYFAPTSQAVLVDDIFRSLYFERFRVPEFVTGTPEQEYDELNTTIAELELRVSELNAAVEKLKADNSEKLNSAFSILKMKNDTFELRKNVAVLNGKFYLVGFVPSVDGQRFNSVFDDIESVSVVLKPPDTDKVLLPPTKLKNGFFSRPFSMLVEMYGLPAYNGINPTGFFALTYTLLFGLMFGDLGQGAVLFLIGLFLSLKMKNKAGGILTRVGVSSMCFGTIYGSVFGFETLLNPLYRLFGFEEKPFEVFHQTNIILLGAVALGALLIAISIFHNIILGFRQKNYEKAIFGPNGIVGLVFYLSVLVGAAVTMALDGIKVFTPLYIAFLIALPLTLMFFRVPLSNLVRYKKLHVGEDEHESIGTFIAENFFELFEFLLSYVTNTMSFLRVGGFILSHAGMMLVVMTLAEGVSKGAAPVIVIIGNIFVMAMEGMIVGIQAIRLEFYEIFSRFYEGDGKPFVPVSVCYDTDVE